MLKEKTQEMKEKKMKVNAILSFIKEVLRWATPFLFAKNLTENKARKKANDLVKKANKAINRANNSD